MMDNEKLNMAIIQLRAYYSVIDNQEYGGYSRESLAKELIEIQDSIEFLESLGE